jgi:hypothetical protein
MIDWQATSDKYGYDILPGCRRPKVICSCDNCGKLAIITIRVKNEVVDNQMPWLCPSCVKKKESAAISARMKQQWENEEYRADRVASTAELLRDPIFKEKHKVSLKRNTHSFSNSPLTQKASESVKALWRDSDYKLKTLSAIAASKDKLRDVKASERYKIAIAKSFAQHRPHSSIQLILYDILDTLNINYEREGPGTRIGYYSFDCLITYGEHKILIECQGDYWHELARVVSRDRAKFTYISEYFPEYEMLYIWEHEFYCKDKVADKLKSRLGINTQDVDFDFSEISLRLNPPTNDVRLFLDSYHYIGKGRGGFCISAEYDGKMIACAVFSSPLRQNTAGQFGLVDGEVRELSRLCIHPSYQKKNFASWFIAKCLKKLSCKIVVAYSDTTVGHVGTIYKASNFQLHHRVAASYWYIDVSGHVMHKKTLYNRALKMGLKENEFADKYGYIKKYGGEKLCFVRYL